MMSISSHDELPCLKLLFVKPHSFRGSGGAQGRIIDPILHKERKGWSTPLIWPASLRLHHSKVHRRRQLLPVGAVKPRRPRAVSARRGKCARSSVGVSLAGLQRH